MTAGAALERRQNGKDGKTVVMTTVVQPLPVRHAHRHLAAKYVMLAALQKRSGSQALMCNTSSQMPPCPSPVPVLPIVRRQRHQHDTQSQGHQLLTASSGTCKYAISRLPVASLATMVQTAEAAFPVSRRGGRLLIWFVFLLVLKQGEAAGSVADSESSTPSHLLHEKPSPISAPPPC
eukprot:4064364-Amphidinium_carterae.1